MQDHKYTGPHKMKLRLMYTTRVSWLAAVSAVALLNIPGFIERLCKLATRKVSEASGTAALLQELEDWHSWLDNALVLDALMQMAIEEAEQSSTGERRLSPDL